MSLDRVYTMLEHSMRQEKRLADLVKLYQDALGLIANKMALHPQMIAQEAIKDSLPIMNEMTSDPWPPASWAKDVSVQPTA